MSGGSYGGMVGVAEDLGWKFRLAMAGMVAVFVGILGWMVWSGVTFSRDVAARHDRAVAIADFHPGDVVRSRVTNFRGMVVGWSCLDTCTYEVRFYQATMQPVWVAGYEIEAAK